MADYTFGVTQVNGLNVGAGQSLTQGLDQITISTAVNILTAGQSGGSATTQAALDKLVQIISLNGQPVIMGLPAGSSAPFTLTFSMEHPGAWVMGTYAAGAVAPASGPQTLCNAIQVAGVNFGFYSDTTLTATLNSELLTSATD